MAPAKVLITGPTGQVALPITLAYAAAGHDVWGAARFRDPEAKAMLEGAGVHCVSIDLVAGDFGALPTDFDLVLNLAVVKSGRWHKDLAANGESAGLLMAHCRNATAFLHCSSAAIYRGGDEPMAEDAPLGDSHQRLFPTYSVSKTAAEVVVRTMARHLGLPTTIARLNVPYGDNGGWPAFHLEQMLTGDPITVHPGPPARYNPIHEDDLIAQTHRLLHVASVPATVVNWAGNEAVSIQEWCAYLGELTGLEPRFVETLDGTVPGQPTDLTRMHELIGACEVGWRDGVRRMVAHRHPELLKPGGAAATT